MENEMLLLKKLNEYYDTKPSEIVTKKIKSKKATLMHVRDALIKTGNIEEEDLKNNLYVGYIKAGILGMNTAHVVVMKDGDEIIMKVHSVEGIIKQNTSEKAIEKFEKVLNELTGRK